MEAHGSWWKPVEVDVEVDGSQWISVEVGGSRYGNSRKSIIVKYVVKLVGSWSIYGKLWKSVEVDRRS